MNDAKQLQLFPDSSSDTNAKLEWSSISSSSAGCLSAPISAVHVSTNGATLHFPTYGMVPGEPYVLRVVATRDSTNEKAQRSVQFVSDKNFGMRTNIV